MFKNQENNKKKEILKKAFKFSLSEYKTNSSKINKNKVNYFMSGKRIQKFNCHFILMREGYDSKNLFYVIGDFKKTHQKIVKKKKRQDLYK